MKFLHTADLHLKDKSHIPIVRSIIRVAEQEQAELIIIAGDLFDASANGRLLEAALLSIWGEYSGSILVVPGNHDDKFLNQRLELASNVIVANQTPYSIAEIEDVFFICVPYQKGISLSDIKIPYYEPAVLITHGTYGTKDEKNSYFPINANDIVNKYHYVALGHYHTWFDKWVHGTLVVNPGAPRQTRKSDKGARFVSIIDTNTWLMDRVSLPVSFVEYKIVNVSMTDSEQEIKDKLLRSVSLLNEHPNAEISLKIQGTLTFSQYSLSERMKSWRIYLEKKGINISQITWDLTKITQISSKLMYSSFARLMIDRITDKYNNEVNDLAPFLFERLQFENQKLLD